MISHCSSALAAQSPRHCLARAWSGVFLTCLALTAPTAKAEIDIDQLIFDAFPLPASTSSLPKPRFPTHFLTLPPPAGARIELQLKKPGAADTPQRAQAAVDGYLDMITDKQQEGSPFDQLLFEPYLSLGLGYQQMGDHEQAIAAFEKAEYISRINNGLYAPQQFPIIERMITSYVARGELARADERRRHLYYLTAQHFGEDSLEVVPTLTALADWNMGFFDRALSAGNNVGFISTNTNMLAAGPGQMRIPRGTNSRMFTPRGMALVNLSAAQNQYYNAIVNILRPRRVSAAQLDQLMDLELRLVESVFLGAHRFGLLEDPVFYMNRRVANSGSRLHTQEIALNPASFKNGQAAYERMQIYQNIDSTADPITRILPSVGLADWHVLFDRRNRARDLYLSAAQRLSDAGASRDQIEAMFEPAVPVQLPEFAPRPHSRRQFGIAEDTPLDYDGWVDVRLRISRFGTASRVEILGGSDNVTRPLERRLQRVIRHAPFRPSLSSVQADAAQDFELRYYFKEIAPPSSLASQ